MIATLVVQADANTLTAPYATIIGAIVGATAGVVGALLTAWSQRLLERSRSKTAREDAVAKELSTAVQQLTISMESALHSMCWLTWYAYVGRGDRLTQKRLDAYDLELHKTLPEMLGYLSTVAALDMSTHDELRPYVYKISDLDVRVAEAGLLLNTDRERMLKEMSASYQQMVDMEMQLPKTIGDIIGERVRNPWRRS